MWLKMLAKDKNSGLFCLSISKKANELAYIPYKPLHPYLFKQIGTNVFSFLIYTFS